MRERIAALLRKAESTNSPEEAEALTAKAEELMIKYSIEQADLEQKGQQVAADVAAFSFKLSMTEAFAKVMITYLANGVVNALKTSRLFIHRGESKAYTLVGAERDVEAAKQLIDSLMAQALSQMKAWWNTEGAALGLKTMERKDQVVAKRQFLVSFSLAATERLVELHTKVMESTTGSELVLVGQLNRVDSYVAETMRVSKANRATTLKGSVYGREAGHAAGMRADLGNTINNNNRASVTR